MDEIIEVDGETIVSSQRRWGWEKKLKVKKHGLDFVLVEMHSMCRFCWLDSCVGVYVFLISRAGFYFLPHQYSSFQVFLKKKTKEKTEREQLRDKQRERKKNTTMALFSSRTWANEQIEKKRKRKGGRKQTNKKK